MDNKRMKKTAKAKCDRLFSEYIHIRDARGELGRCCTCGKIEAVKDLDCGHFQSRRYEATRFDEENCALQCKYCNRFKQGEQYKFGRYLDERFGEGTADRIAQKSRMVCKRTENDYQWLAIEIKGKIAKLR